MQLFTIPFTVYYSIVFFLKNRKFTIHGHGLLQETVKVPTKRNVDIHTLHASKHAKLRLTSAIPPEVCSPFRHEDIAGRPSFGHLPRDHPGQRVERDL